MSYISLDILTNYKSPIPQFLSGTDSKYYDLLIEDVIKLNNTDCTKENMTQVIKYCENKIRKNELIFQKSEVMRL